MRVLITGAGGFIGSHLVDSQLEQGHCVRAVDLHVERLAHVADHPRLEVIAGDLTDEALLDRVLAGVTKVYHLASAHLDVGIPDRRYWEVNVDGTARLLRAARRAGVRRVVHCSSVGVFGDVRRPPADEESSCSPTNIYELTKLAGERTALRYACATGLSVVAARPAWVYGPRCPRTRKLLRTIKRRRFVIIGDGQNLRHPIYVADLVRGLERCGDTGAAGQVYILAGPAPVTVEALTRTAAEVVGAPPPSVHLPVAPALAAGAMLQAAFGLAGRQPPFSQRSVDFFVKDNAYATEKARHGLGFQAQTELRDGLARTWEWLAWHGGGQA
jgi:nucleoside-diphosphate-sugar epimerase